MFREADVLDDSRAVQPALAATQTLLDAKRWDLLDTQVDRLEEVARERPWVLAQVFYVRSHLAESQGDNRAAIGHMHRALIFSPGHRQFLGRVESLYAQAGDSRSAEIARQRHSGGSEVTP